MDIIHTVQMRDVAGPGSQSRGCTRAADPTPSRAHTDTACLRLDQRRLLGSWAAPGNAQVGVGTTVSAAQSGGFRNPRKYSRVF